MSKTALPTSAEIGHYPSNGNSVRSTFHVVHCKPFECHSPHGNTHKFVEKCKTRESCVLFLDNNTSHLGIHEHKSINLVLTVAAFI